jgi:ribonuclease P/MRP protein subunit RPP1
MPFSHCQVTCFEGYEEETLLQKKTIRIDRLFPNEDLTSTKFKLADWISWNSVSSEGGANQLEPSSIFEEHPCSPICGVIKGSHEKPHNPDVSVFAKLSE